MESPEREIELFDYIEVLLKRKWLILLGTLSCVVIYAGYLYIKSQALPLYEASAQIYIVQPQSKDSPVGVSTFTPEAYRTIALAGENILTMDKYQRGLIDSIGLSFRESPLVLDVEVKDSGRLVMRVSAADTLLARRVLDAWVDTFLAQTQELNAAESSRYYAYISAQYQRARENLDRTDSAITALTEGLPVDYLQHLQQIYSGNLEKTHKAALDSKQQLEEKKSRAIRLAEMLQGAEVNGVPIYAVEAENRSHLQEASLPPLARQMLVAATTLDSLKNAAVEAEAQHKMALLAFDQEHGFVQMSRDLEEAGDAFAKYQRAYLEANSRQMIAKVNLEALTEELKKHERVIGPARGGSQTPDQTKRDPTALEINPVYLELERQRAAEGLAYEKARVFAERGAKELKQLEQHQEETQRVFVEMQVKRQMLANQFDQDLAELKGRIDYYQAALEATQQRYLNAKQELGNIEIAVETLTAQVEDQQEQLSSLEEHAKKVQLSVANSLAERDRLERRKATHSGTYDRFDALVEEARISKEKTGANLRVISRDVTSEPVSATARAPRLPVSAAVGLALSTVVALLVEYIQKARKRQAARAA